MAGDRSWLSRLPRPPELVTVALASRLGRGVGVQQVLPHRACAHSQQMGGSGRLWKAPADRVQQAPKRCLDSQTLSYLGSSPKDCCTIKMGVCFPKSLGKKDQPGVLAGARAGLLQWGSEPCDHFRTEKQAA